VKLGNYVNLGNDVTLGNYVKLGNDVNLGNDVTLGNYVNLGNDVTLGNCVKLGDDVTLGNCVKLGDDGTYYKWSPLQIQGSKHLLCVVGPNIISIGCERHTSDEWNTKYKEIGVRSGYTADQIREYRNLLDMAIDWQKKLKGSVDG